MILRTFAFLQGKGQVPQCRPAVHRGSNQGFVEKNAEQACDLFSFSCRISKTGDVEDFPRASLSGMYGGIPLL